jgi:hypothetical protein
MSIVLLVMALVLAAVVGGGVSLMDDADKNGRW